MKEYERFYNVDILYFKTKGQTIVVKYDQLYNIFNST